MANMTSSIAAAAVAAELGAAQFDEILPLVEHYRDDPRVQVVKACQRALKRHEKEAAERTRVDEMYERLAEFGGDGVVLGVDEVGRGSVAGPLTVCAVQLPATPHIWGLNDSKKLSPAKREALSVRICDDALAVGIAHIEPAVIDDIGMAAAMRLAVQTAVKNSGVEPDCVLMDGNPLHAHPAEKNIVKGDALIASIAAASIVAKVTRDDLMCQYAEEYPQYHLAECKGYASAEHIAAIKKYGLSDIHRASFCGNFLETERLF